VATPPQTTVPMPNGAHVPMPPPASAFGVPSAPPAPSPFARAPVPPAPPPEPVKGLPADAPKVVITGSVYSPNPKHRVAIVNGQVVREGAQVAPGLVLEAITPIDIVLAFRGAKYRVLL
jgi:general secretion pathway protein B